MSHLKKIEDFKKEYDSFIALGLTEDDANDLVDLHIENYFKKILSNQSYKQENSTTSKNISNNNFQFFEVPNIKKDVYKQKNENYYDDNIFNKINKNNKFYSIYDIINNIL